VKPSAFEYHAPETVEEAASLLAELGDDAKVLAGGQSLVPIMSLRLASFGHLVDIGRIPALSGITNEGTTTAIGATTVQAAIENADGLSARAPLLTRSTPLIGHFQIRNRGTLGGSIAHADPAAEYPAVALALDAEMEAVSLRGRRRIPAGEFFDGFWSTTLAPDEVLTAVRFPVWSGRCGFAIHEFARRFGDFAIAGAVVALELDDECVRRCAIGLLGLGPTPLRATAAEHAATTTDAGAIDPDQLGRLAVADLTDVPSDLHGSADYRRRVGAAMVSRAWRDAITEARDA
jgi:carbon-monoxide dehydrogenase medium subunit